MPRLELSRLPQGSIVWFAAQGIYQKGRNSVLSQNKKYWYSLTVFYRLAVPCIYRPPCPTGDTALAKSSLTISELIALERLSRVLIPIAHSLFSGSEQCTNQKQTNDAYQSGDTYTVSDDFGSFRKQLWCSRAFFGFFFGEGVASVLNSHRTITIPPYLLFPSPHSPLLLEVLNCLPWALER